jgi:hypothetical protein
VYDGTWSSGAVPLEIRDYELMKTMHWSWLELQAAPSYVRKYCWDLTVISRQAQLRR